MRALDFIVQTLLELYIMAFILRFILQWTRADFHNPLSQFILQITSPLARPVRRVIPGWRGIDLSTLLIAYLLKVLAGTIGILMLGQVPGNLAGLFYFSLIQLAILFLRLYLFIIIGQVLLSWFAPYHPVSGVLRTMTAPVLRPIQRVIPPIANIDLSPLFALLAIQAAIMLVSELL